MDEILSYRQYVRPFYVMAKPAGARCNLRCTYCYYLEKSSLYPAAPAQTMSDELLEFLEGKEGLYVEFEMKTKPEALYPEERLHAYCDKLYDAVMAVKPADATFVFTSGDYRGLRYLQAKHPGVDLLLITSKPCNDETIDLCKAMGIKRMGATMDGTSRKAVKKAHKEGLIVSLWPGQSVEDFMLGAYLGCDYMCTDVPIEVKGWLAEKAPWIKVKY